MTERTRSAPTFLIIGAAKSGTTALYRWLQQHPDVYMPANKQPHYFAGITPRFCGPGDDLFNRDIVTEPEQYGPLFAPGASCRARGEASPFYLYYSRQTAAAVRAAVPDCRLVVLLREPVARAYAGYLHLVRDGRESGTFAQALEREAERRRGGWEPLWAHRELGLYGQQLAEVLRVFPRRQVGVWLYDQMCRDPAALYAEVCRFIGVDHDFVPAFTHHNTGGAPRHAALHALMVKLRAPHIAKAVLPERMAQWVVARYLQRRPPPGEVAEELRRSYRQDADTLRGLLPDLDFAAWGQ